MCHPESGRTPLPMWGECCPPCFQVHLSVLERPVFSTKDSHSTGDDAEEPLVWACPGTGSPRVQQAPHQGSRVTTPTHPLHPCSLLPRGLCHTPFLLAAGSPHAPPSRSAPGQVDLLSGAWASMTTTPMGTQEVFVC